MRYALRRILWIVPTLAAISVLAFWALTRSLGPPAAPELGPAARQRLSELPRFVNPRPRTVRDLALEATRVVAENGQEVAAARAELVRLGGAALPHVLPRLDTLPPAGRARVAQALSPVARRMGVGSTTELDSPDAAVVFWTRYWQDRAIDFRPAVMRRLVRRSAERTTDLRSEDVRELDTYALPELIAALEVTRDELPRARRLSQLLAHVTGLPWAIGERATPEQALGLIVRWHSWWTLNRSDYVTFDGPERALAMLTETQYGKWAVEAARSRFGTTAGGRPVLDVLGDRAPVTLWLLASGWLGGYLVGIALGVLGAGFRGTRWSIGAHGTRFSRIPRVWWDRALSAAAVALVALPSAALASALSPAGAAATTFRAALVMTLVAGAIVSRYQRRASGDAMLQNHARTLLALGATDLRVAARTARAAGGTAISLAGIDLATLLTTALVIERCFDLPGLSQPTLEAILVGDVSWLMALVVAGTLFGALAQIASDALLMRLDPRLAGVVARRRGVPE
jgi:peptide/nickel transport system permease protein